jgi:molybdopterin molybdotransferase
MAENVLGFAEALEVVLAQARGLQRVVASERVGLLDAAGRVLAEKVVAERDQPPFDRATRDGFAVKVEDVSPAANPGLKSETWGTQIRVIGSVRAGQQWSGAAMGAGEAIEIMTGAPMPPGADAVVMVEHVSVEGEVMRVEAGRTLRVGENVVPRAAEARVGDSLLPVGRVMHAAEIAVAASCGCAELSVFARPKVAIIATGDELVELAAVGDADSSAALRNDKQKKQLDGAQIYNSNSYALAAMVREEGGVAARLAVARDSFAELTERVQRGMAADLLLLSGGVSKGKYDLVEEVLAELGAEFLFTGAMIQPGRPVVFGRLPTFDPARPWVYFFGLPGNPVSTQVCFHLFVAPMLRALAGRSEIAPQFVEARLAEDVRGGAKVTRFLPAELSGAWDGVSVKVVGWQGSGDVAANARGNGYVVLPADMESFAKGETVRVLLR